MTYFIVKIKLFLGEVEIEDKIIQLLLMHLKEQMQTLPKE